MFVFYASSVRVQNFCITYFFLILLISFANTVTGQFYGHTHNDEFMVFYDYETNSIPVNVGFVTPSVTTFTGLNPSFRFYTLDGPYEGASWVSTNNKIFSNYSQHIMLF